jgi:hypothetical protein
MVGCYTFLSALVVEDQVHSLSLLYCLYVDHAYLVLLAFFLVSTSLYSILIGSLMTLLVSFCV